VTAKNTASPRSSIGVGSSKLDEPKEGLQDGSMGRGRVGVSSAIRHNGSRPRQKSSKFRSVKRPHRANPHTGWFADRSASAAGLNTEGSVADTKPT